MIWVLAWLIESVSFYIRCWNVVRSLRKLLRNWEAQVLLPGCARSQENISCSPGSDRFRDEEGKSHREAVSSEEVIQFMGCTKLTVWGVPEKDWKREDGRGWVSCGAGGGISRFQRKDHSGSR